MGRYGGKGRDGEETIYERRASKQATSKHKDVEVKVQCIYEVVSVVVMCRNVARAPHNDWLTGVTD